MLSYGENARNAARAAAEERAKPENRKGPSRETIEQFRARAGDKVPQPSEDK